MAGRRESASVRYTRDYVRIPSVNPMRRTDLDPAITGERRYAEHLRQQLRGLGLDAQLVGDAARPSLVAEARVADAGETILVASHLDTVPVDGMHGDPFDPRVSDGRSYRPTSSGPSWARASIRTWARPRSRSDAWAAAAPSTSCPTPPGSCSTAAACPARTTSRCAPSSRARSRSTT